MPTFKSREQEARQARRERRLQTAVFIGIVVVLLVFYGLPRWAEWSNERQARREAEATARIQPTATAVVEAGEALDELLPVRAGTPVPPAIESISSRTVGRVEALARWKIGSLTDAAWSPRGGLLALAGAGGVSLYNAETLQVVRRIESPAGVLAVSFSPQASLLAAGCRDGLVRLWDARAGWSLRTLAGHQDLVNRIAFSPDGSLLASASADGSIRLWQVSTGIQLARFEGHAGGVPSLAFSPDGSLLASGSLDGTVRLWDLALKSSVGPAARVLERHQDWVLSVAFSPDGSLLASGSCREKNPAGHCLLGDIILWDVPGALQTGAEASLEAMADAGSVAAELEGHPSRVYSLAFSPDGSLLAAGAADGSIRLWDVSTVGQNPLVRVLRGHRDAVSGLTFSPDGRFLASCSRAGAVRLWGVVR